MSNRIDIEVTGKNTSRPALREAQQDADKLTGSVKRVGEIAGGVLAANAIGRIGQAAGRAFTSSINAASDLGESINAVDKIFGDSAQEILAWGNANAAAYGLSKRAFNEAIVPLGASLRNAGLDLETVSDKTLDLTQRAADMASVFNTDVDEALAAIQAGLRGEADPLERFGVGLSAAKVEARAMAESGKENAKQLTEQEKALARVAIIMEQTSSVAGDFQDTSDQLANSQRIARAELENAQAAIGEGLLPILGTLASTAADVLGVFNELPGPVKEIVTVVGALAAGLLLVVPRLVAARAALASFNIVGERGARTMSRLGVAVGKLGVAGVAMSGINRLFKESSDELSRWAEEVETAEGQELDARIKSVREELENLNNKLKDVPNWDIGFLDTNIWWTFDNSVVQAADRADFLKERLAQLQHEQKMQERATRQAAEAQAEQAAELEQLGVITSEAAAQFVESASMMSEAWKTSVEEISSSATAYQEMMDGLQEGEEANLADYLRVQAEKVAAARAHNENIVKIQARASADVRDILAEDAIENPELAALMVKATDEQWAQLEENARIRMEAAGTAQRLAMENAIPQLRGVAERAGTAVANGIAAKIAAGAKLSVEEARTLMDGVEDEVELRELLAKIEPYLDEESRAETETKIDRLARARRIAMLPEILPMGELQRNAKKGPNQATGGIIGARTYGIPGAGVSIAKVGEEGEEYVELPYGTRVIPSGQSRAMDAAALASGGPAMLTPTPIEERFTIIVQISEEVVGQIADVRIQRHAADEARDLEIGAGLY